MQLSEAIRLGAMLHPQGYGAFLGGQTIDTFDKAQIRETCALAAAWLASGGKSHTEVALFDSMQPRGYTRQGQTLVCLDMPPAWNPLLGAVASCPAGCPFWIYAVVADVVQHLNDHHRWTREAIADWVASIEVAIEPASAAAAVREDVDLSTACAIREEERSSVVTGDRGREGTELNP